MWRKKTVLGVHPAEAGEALSLVLSILMIAGLVAYLGWRMTHAETPHVAVTTMVGTAEVLSDGRYAIPITAYNRSARTLTEMSLRVRTAAGVQDIIIEYVPGQASRTAYVYVDDRDAEVQVVPAYYRVD